MKRNTKLWLLLIVFAFAITGCGELIEKKEDSKDKDTGSGVEIEKIAKDDKGSSNDQNITDPAKQDPLDQTKPTAKAEETDKPKETKKNIEETALPKDNDKPLVTEAPKETTKPLATKEPAKEKEQTLTATPKPTVKATEKTKVTATPKPATKKPTATATAKPTTTKPAATATAKPATKKPAATSRPSTGSVPEAKTDADVEKYNKQGTTYKVAGITVTPCTPKQAWADAGYIRINPDYTISADKAICGCWGGQELRVTAICSNGFVQVEDVTVYPTGKKAPYYKWSLINTKHHYVYTNEKYMQYTKPKWATFKGYDPEEDVIKPVLRILKANGHKIYGDDKEKQIKTEKAWLKDLEENFPNNIAEYKNLLAIGEIDQSTYNEWVKEDKKRIEDQKKLIKYLENLDYMNDSHRGVYDPNKPGNPVFYNQNQNRFGMSGLADEDLGGIHSTDDIVADILTAYGIGRDGKPCSPDTGYEKGKSSVFIQWDAIDTSDPKINDVGDTTEKKYWFSIEWV